MVFYYYMDGWIMKELIEIMSELNKKMLDSKAGLTTYEDDSQADHGDGQQCGREEAYREAILICATKIITINGR